MVLIASTSNNPCLAGRPRRCVVPDAVVSSSAQPPRQGRTGDEVDIVDDRLHQGQFLLKRAGQVANVFAEGDQRTRYQKTGVVMGVGHLVQTSRQGQRFACTGLARKSPERLKDRAANPAQNSVPGFAPSSVPNWHVSASAAV